MNAGWCESDGDGGGAALACDGGGGMCVRPIVFLVSLNDSTDQHLG